MRDFFFQIRTGLGMSTPATSGKDISPNPDVKRQTLMFLLMLCQDHQNMKWGFAVCRPQDPWQEKGMSTKKCGEKFPPKNKECQDATANEDQEMCSAVVEKSRAES